MSISNIEIQDENGNIYYPKTASNNVFFEDGTTFQQKLDGGALRGQQGSKGDTGEKGERGQQGIQGLPGVNGKDGVSVSTNLVDGKATGSIKAKNVVENDTQILGQYSATFGDWCKASGMYSNAKGTYSNAEGIYSHAEGFHTTATGKSSHAEGNYTIAIGDYSHSEGCNADAEGIYSHAEGYNATATGLYSHSEGYNSIATGDFSHAEGSGATSISNGSHAEGCGATATGKGSHAEGYYAISYNDYSHAQGIINKQVSDDDMFWVGNGILRGTVNGKPNFIRSNAFRVTGAGATYGMSAFNSTGADYAEFFEWDDGNPNNEDRVGHFVTFENDKIKIANQNDDYILGIISGNPSVIGNSHNDMWNEMYIRDEFDRIVYEDVEVPDAVYENQNINPLDIDTNKESNILISEAYDEEVLDKPKHMEHRMKLNPKYDASHEYIPREKRPEWSAVGMFGVLSVYDDGTCTVNGYAKVSNNGTATKSDSGYRVLKRSTNNIVKILFRS